MKKILFLFFICLSSVMTNHAQTSDFEIDENGVLTHYHGRGGDVLIPDSVILIGNSAFYNCRDLRSITIPGSVTSIGKNAFAYCDSLQKFTVQWTLPLTVQASAFVQFNAGNCTLKVPKGSVEAYQAAAVWQDFGTIEEETDETTSIQSPVLKNPKDTTTVSLSVPACDDPVHSGTFGENGELSWLLCPNGVLIIRGKGAMPQTPDGSSPWADYPDSVTSVVIEEGITEIANASFFGFENITSVALPSTLRTIGNNAFVHCRNLTSLTGLEHVTFIGISAFQECEKLTSTLTFSEELNALSESAFRYSGLTSVELPNSLDRLEADVFADCYNLRSIRIPASVLTIADGAFVGENLQEVSVEWETPLENVSEFAFDNEKLNACILLIPPETKALYAAAPVWKDFGVILEYNNLPEFVINEGQVLMAYYGAGGDVVIPDGVVSIERGVFKDKTNIFSIAIPASVANIDNLAFNGASAVREVCVHWSAPYDLSASEIFSGIDLQKATLHVPSGTAALYREFPGWKDFGNIVEESAAPDNETSE